MCEGILPTTRSRQVEIMWYYTALVIGFVLGFITCAILTVAQRADDEMELFFKGGQEWQKTRKVMEKS